MKGLFISTAALLLVSAPAMANGSNANNTTKSSVFKDWSGGHSF